MSKFSWEKGHAKVEGHTNLIREESSNAIINRDVEGYRAAITRKKSFQLQRDEINTLKKLNLEEKPSEMPVGLNA